MSRSLLPLLLLVGCADTSGLEGQVADLSAALDDLRADHDALQAEHDALLADVGAVADRASALETAVADAEGRLDGLDASVAGLGLSAVVRTQTFGSIPAGVHVVFVVECEEGEVAVGGGAGFDGNLSAEEVQQTYPIEADGTVPEAGDTPTGWVSILKNNSGTSMIATGFVVCARL